MTVRVDLAVFPALSVATYSMVSVAAAEVSIYRHSDPSAEIGGSSASIEGGQAALS
jgi:hypothetical protein